MFLRRFQKGTCLLRWQIGDDQPTDSAGGCRLTKTFDAIGKNGVIIAHEEQWHRALSGDLTSNVYTFVNGHSLLKCHMPGVLNSDSVRERIAKRDAQFDEVRSSFYGRQHNLDTLLWRRITAHKIRNERSTSSLPRLLERLRDSGRRYMRRRGRACPRLVAPSGCLHRLLLNNFIEKHCRDPPYQSTERSHGESGSYDAAAALLIGTSRNDLSRSGRCTGIQYASYETSSCICG